MSHIITVLVVSVVQLDTQDLILLYCYWKEDTYVFFTDMLIDLIMNRRVEIGEEMILSRFDLLWYGVLLIRCNNQGTITVT